MLPVRAPTSEDMTLRKGAGRTRISRGYSLTQDAVAMDMLGRTLAQTVVTTCYNSDATPAGTPALTTFTIGNAALGLPRAGNCTLDADHRLSTLVSVTAKDLRPARDCWVRFHQYARSGCTTVAATLRYAKGRSGSPE